MILLLDTHVLLWWLEDPNKLSKEAHEKISDPKNQILISSAVIWEIVIKSMIGKLTIPDDLEAVIEHSRFQQLDISHRHALAVHDLPAIHRDPFDRMLAAQSFIEEATIVTRDEKLIRYLSDYIQA